MRVLRTYNSTPNTCCLEKLHERNWVDGAEGMWENDEDPLSALDTNEGYCSRLIGNPVTVLKKIEEFRTLGIEMLHLDIRDLLFQHEVLPTVIDL